MRIKKLAQQAGDQKDSTYYDRIKEMAAKDRERTRIMKQEYENMKRLIDNTIQVPSNNEKEFPQKLTANNLKKLENPQEMEESSVMPPKKAPKQRNNIPKWALTTDKLEENEEQECEELIEFMNTLDYQEYIEDYEVKSMVAALKKRVKEIQKESHIQPKPKQEMKKGEKCDGLSQLSNYEAKSVASEKTQSKFQFN